MSMEEYDCPNCGAHIVNPGKVLGADDQEAEAVALDALAEVREIAFEHVGRDSDFYEKWLCRSVTKISAVPDMIREMLRREPARDDSST